MRRSIRSAGPAWRRVMAHPLWLAPVLGGVAACGFRPLALWPLTILMVALLIELVARAPSWRRAATIGWLFGLGHFTVGNFWIATAFTYQSNMPQWLGMVGVVLLALYLALFPALATLGAWTIAHVAERERGAGTWAIGLLLMPCWIVTEWLRAWVFTGFAWNPLGVALLGAYDAPGLARIAGYVGTYGLSGVLVGVGALLRTAVRVSLAPAAAHRLATALVTGTGVVALVLVMELPARLPTGDAAGALPVTVVQPDFRQETLDDPTLYEANFQRIAGLTRPLRPGQQRLVLWPESGVPDYLRDGYPTSYYRDMTYAADPTVARGRIGRVIGTRALLLTGAVDLVFTHGRVVAARNVVTAIDADGDILGGYAKAHLVPFGEYLALRWLLEPLGATRLVPGAIDFEPGRGPRTIDLGPWGRVGVQICYEITFSGQVVDPRHRPDYLFNPSNDGWFGSWGPPQHLAQARLRAIEEGLPVLRSTTTGISAVIDSRGIVRHHLGRNVAGRIDTVVPYAVPPTPFARLGNALPLAWAAMLLAISLVALRWRRR